LPPIIHGDGEQILDYVHVDDVIRALLLAAEGRAPDGAVVNIGSGHGICIADLIRQVIAVSGTGLAPVHGPADWTAGTRRVAATTRAAELLGWRAEIPFEEGLRQMWAEIS
jgi:UDP-glucose 4-epimerase